jgi:hypothetical protein
MIFPDKIIKQLHGSIPEKTWYRNWYLQSSHWKSFSRKIKKSANGKCSQCKQSAGALDCHHLNYEHLWHETKEDVIVLCRTCHEKRHK